MKFSITLPIFLILFINYTTAVCNIEGYQHQETLEIYNNHTKKFENITRSVYNHDTIICNGITLSNNEVLPTLEKGYSAKILKCIDCQLNEIKMGSLIPFKELQEIYFNQCIVQNIGPNSFSELKKLKVLDLSQNFIGEIPEVILEDANLNLVNFSGNNITKIAKGAFKNVKIQILDFSKNNLYQISQANFVGSTIWKILDLSQNCLSHFKMPDILSHNVHLNLSYNNLGSIDFGSLKGATFLGHNYLTTILKTGPFLTTLDLESNLIKFIPSNVFIESKGLLSLNLQKNNLENLGLDVFSGLSNLETLNLAKNHLQTLKVGIFRHLHNLTFLNLSHNRLSSFAFGIFSNLDNLRVLDLSNNPLKQVHPPIFTSLKLVTLHLNEINLTDFHIQKLVKVLPTLKKISLNGNHLQCNHIFHIKTVLTENNVTLISGNHFKSKNIDGIKCDVKEIDKNVDYENLNEVEMENEREIQISRTGKSDDLVKEIHILTSVSICVLVFVIILIIIKLVQEFQKYFYMRRYKYRLVDGSWRNSGISNKERRISRNNV